MLFGAIFDKGCCHRVGECLIQIYLGVVQMLAANLELCCSPVQERVCVVLRLNLDGRAGAHTRGLLHLLELVHSLVLGQFDAVFSIGNLVVKLSFNLFIHVLTCFEGSLNLPISIH